MKQYVKPSIMRYLLSPTLFCFILICWACTNEADQNRGKSAPEDATTFSISEIASQQSLGLQLLTNARNLYGTTQYDSAFALAEQAKDFFEHKKDWSGYVQAMTVTAAVHLWQNDLAACEMQLQQAEKIANKHLKELDPARAALHDGWATLQSQRGNIELSLKHFHKELDIHEALQDPSPKEMAECLRSLGEVYIRDGDHETGLSHLERALEVWTEVDPNLTTNKAGTILLSLGNAHYFRGEYDLAREYYLQTEAIRKANGHTDDLLAANVYMNLGVIEKAKKRYKSSLEYHQRSLEICQRMFGDEDLSTAPRYGNMGTTYMELGKYDEAIEAHEKTLKIVESHWGKDATKFILANLGAVYVKKGQFERAQAYYDQAIEMIRRTLGKRHWATAQCLNMIGELHFENGAYQQALKTFQQALQANTPGFSNDDPASNPDTEHVFNDEQLLESLQKKAATFLRLSRHVDLQEELLLAAVQTVDVAAQLIEKIRHGYKVEGAKLFLAEKASGVHELGIEAANALARATDKPAWYDKAYTYAEKSRAGILLDAIAESDAKQFAGIPDDVLQQEKRLRTKLAALDRQVVQEETKGEKRGQARLDSLRNDLFDLKREYEALLAGFEHDYPKFYELKYQTQTADVKYVRDMILEQDDALIEYFVGQDSIVIFVVTPKQLRVVESAKDASFENDVEQLRAAITGQTYDRYVESAYRLYVRLLKPVQQTVTNKDLIIVPDGVLCYLPFEVLLTNPITPSETVKDYRALSYLIKSNKISYAYSATLLGQTMKRRTDLTKRDFIAFAPVFKQPFEQPSEDFQLTLTRWREDENNSRTRPPMLPASETEVRNIERVFSKNRSLLQRWLGNQSRILLEADATERHLKTMQPDQYRVIHLATHGIVDPGRVKLSRMLFADEGNSEDGQLYLGEIYNLNLNAELVTLSACETGLGRFAKGEGLIGLSRGFLYAGARNLLVSLWQVNDISTAKLMVQFYEDFLSGEDKATSLRHAKLALIESHPKYARPYYWAPFILIGN